MKRLIRISVCVLAVLLVAVFSAVAYGSGALPDSIVSYNNQDIRYNKIYYIGIDSEQSVGYQSSSKVSPRESEIKLFGIIPVKNAQLISGVQNGVFVSGESFGIKLYTDGVIVVGTKDVEAEAGKCNPAKEAGIIKGDIIIKINGQKMTSSEEVEKLLDDNNGKEYEITVKRNGNYKSFTVKPVYSPSEGCYKVGLWVRDSTAGIGTVTFYNPASNTVAALGHPITDVDTGEIMPIFDGEAVRTTVTKLNRSRAGETGSLICSFSNDAIGRLTENLNCGIYGRYTCDIKDLKYYEVASAQEVERGSATLICTLDGDGPKGYDVELSRLSYREGNNDKNMIVKIVDEELMAKSGGIVQGMSGSPIIQNGKLVGALTHVIVDNPQKGYAIFAEKMVEASDNGK